MRPSFLCLAARQLLDLFFCKWPGALAAPRGRFRVFLNWVLISAGWSDVCLTERTIKFPRHTATPRWNHARLILTFASNFLPAACAADRIPICARFIRKTTPVLPMSIASQFMCEREPHLVSPKFCFVVPKHTSGICCGPNYH